MIVSNNAFIFKVAGSNIEQKPKIKNTAGRLVADSRQQKNYKTVSSIMVRKASSWGIPWAMACFRAAFTA